MNPELRELILATLKEVDGIVYNNDWPTEGGQMGEDGNCPVLTRNNRIRELIAQIQ